MTRKKGLRAFSKHELLQELARRHAEERYRDGMTMTDMELAVEQLKSESGDPGIKAMLRRMKPEKPTGKACPKCGKRIPVKARDRERTVRSLSGPITFKRNYHHCEECKYGFYPVDRLLNLPEEGELTSEMEKRVLDFGINDVYGECAARWNLHYPQQPISENLVRRVIARVGAQCEAADQGQLQEELKPSQAPAEVLVVEADGSLLPIRGPEPWKEAKVGVIYRHDCDANRPIAGSARYVAVVNGFGEFAPVLEEALHVERINEVPLVVWVGDGAPCNWTLADQLAPDAVQILDWHHAVEHAVDCGKVLLGEESPFVPLWQKRAEALLSEGPEAIIAELMECVPEAEKRRRDKDALQALDNLVRYYRANLHRMKYRLLREQGLPIGSGAVESAHRHVLQTRMKRAGQRWAMRNARRMARLRAAYRTAGALAFYDAIRRAAATRRPTAPGHRNGFRYAHQGRRDPDRCARAASN